MRIEKNLKLRHTAWCCHQKHLLQGAMVHLLGCVMFVVFQIQALFTHSRVWVASVGLPTTHLCCSGRIQQRWLIDLPAFSFSFLIFYFFFYTRSSILWWPLCSCVKQEGKHGLHSKKKGPYWKLVCMWCFQPKLFVRSLGAFGEEEKYTFLFCFNALTLLLGPISGCCYFNVHTGFLPQQPGTAFVDLAPDVSTPLALNS